MPSLSEIYQKVVDAIGVDYLVLLLALVGVAAIFGVPAATAVALGYVAWKTGVLNKAIAYVTKKLGK